MEWPDLEEAKRLTDLTQRRRVQLVRWSDRGSEWGHLALPDPVLLERAQESWRTQLEGTSEEDAGWDWVSKASNADHTTYASGVEHVLLICQDDVHGMMITSRPDSPPALSEFGKNLLYVEYLATAPRNRPEVASAPMFRAIGPLLLRHAILRSITLGFAGCVGLHSKPGAVKKYVSYKLLQRGLDFQQGYEYFEGDTNWAKQFLAWR